MYREKGHKNLCEAFTPVSLRRDLNFFLYTLDLYCNDMNDSSVGGKKNKMELIK